MTVKETITQKIVEAGGRLQVRSALNPALWLCGIVTMPILLSSIAFGVELSFVLQLVAATPVAIAAIGYIGLLVFDRDKLQSEDYQIRKQSLELIQEKGDHIPINATSIEHISNPDLPSLTDESGDAK